MCSRWKIPVAGEMSERTKNGAINVGKCYHTIVAFIFKWMHITLGWMDFASAFLHRGIFEENRVLVFFCFPIRSEREREE